MRAGPIGFACGCLLWLSGCGAAPPAGAPPTAPTAPTSQSSLVIELVGERTLVAGEPVQREILALKDALERHRGSATVAEARVFGAPRGAVETLLSAAEAAGLSGLRLVDAYGTVPVVLRSEKPITHVLFDTDDGRFKLGQLLPTKEEGPEWAGVGDMDRAAAWLGTRCFKQPCQLRVVEPTRRLLMSSIHAAGELARGIPELEISAVGMLKLGAQTVSGRLAPEVIQGIVREHFGLFRQCYELGLAKDANLKGKIAVRFVIGRDGKVSNVADGGSDIPDPEVRDCVLKAFYQFEFPQPEGGIVTVVYPIMLAPG